MNHTETLDMAGLRAKRKCAHRCFRLVTWLFTDFQVNSHTVSEIFFKRSTNITQQNHHRQKQIDKQKTRNATITSYSQRTIYSDFWTESGYKHRISENNPREYTETRDSQ